MPIILPNKIIHFNVSFLPIKEKDVLAIYLGISWDTQCTSGVCACVCACVRKDVSDNPDYSSLLV